MQLYARPHYFTAVLRYSEQLRMRNRIAGLIIGVLAVVCLGLVLSVVYPFNTASPHAANRRANVSPSAMQTRSARQAASSWMGAALAFEGAVTADSAWYERVVEDGYVAVEYWTPNGSEYRWVSVQRAEAAECLKSDNVESDETKVIRESRGGVCVTFVTKRNTAREPEPVLGTASVFVNNLCVASYEQLETDSSRVTTYRPQSGWVETRVTYRMTDVSGTVRVDDETGAVTSANVSWTLTRGETYAQYALSNLVGRQEYGIPGRL